MIRLAQPSDLTELANIERSAAQRFLGTPMAWVANAGTVPEQDLADACAAGLLWVAVQGRQPCGFALARPWAAQLFLEEMSVALPAQGQGFGRALIQAVLAQARRQYVAVVLTTDRYLPWNGPFYRRMGFVELLAPYPPAVRARLQAEADAGFDPARRCAMAFRLPA